MPNWCDNWVTVISDDEKLLDEIEGLLADDDGRLFAFHRLLPVPVEVESDPDGMVGYHWRVDNWGTKWDTSSEAHFERTPGRLFYWFQTAWAPPSPVVEVLSERFPTVKVGHAWDEAGCDFGGYVILEGGSVDDQCEGGSRASGWDEMMEWSL